MPGHAVLKRAMAICARRYNHGINHNQQDNIAVPPPRPFGDTPHQPMTALTTPS